MFSLSDIPLVLTCPKCGEPIKEMDLPEAVEFYTARLLAAQVAPARMPGFDVHQSLHVPDKTFQVKVARAREQKAETKVVNGRESEWKQSPTWTWHEPVALSADIYVLYGIREDLVYSFVVPVWLWEDESYDTGKGGRLLTISTDQYSRCGRYRNSFKRNKFWQYLVRSWPSGFLEICQHYAMCTPMEQADLFGVIDLADGG